MKSYVAICDWLLSPSVMVSSMFHVVAYVSKESTCNAGSVSSIPGLRRSSGEGHGNPLQYYCLENSMDRGTWKATVHGITNSQTWLSDSHTHTHTHTHTIFHHLDIPYNKPE